MPPKGLIVGQLVFFLNPLSKLSVLLPSPCISQISDLCPAGLSGKEPKDTVFRRGQKLPHDLFVLLIRFHL